MGDSMGNGWGPGNFARPGDGGGRPGQPQVPAQFRPQEGEGRGQWWLAYGPAPEPSRPHPPRQYVPPQYVPSQHSAAQHTAAQHTAAQHVPSQYVPSRYMAPPQYVAPASPPPQYAAAPPPYPPPGPRGRRGRGGRGGSHTVRNVAAAVGAVAVLVIGIAAVANRGHSVKTAGSALAGGGAATTAGIGSAITLAGSADGERAAVTVTKVIAAARPAGEFDAASPGKRLYAVQFRLRDTGSTAYSDAPSNGAAVVDSTGQSYDSSLDEAAGCPSFATPEDIGAGASGLGCVVFEVPKSARITQVQFTLDSGTGPDTGQWNAG